MIQKHDRLEGVEEELGKSKPLDGIFYASILLKGVDGVLEVIAAVAILIFNPPRMHYYLDLIAQTDFARHHQSLFAHFVLPLTNSYTDNVRLFLVIYLLIHAAIKIISVVGLMLNKRWAYPFALITLGALMLYQLYDIFFVRPTAFMIILTVFDIFVLWLIWREYKIRILNKQDKRAVNKEAYDAS
ncbi:MAG TPA: DUF2127 domain-containing protein [Dongiaceae bacterium]|nr:DUF2127 domain-containing protein [Dongiaceae bacterium]